jgi:ribosomal protein S8E
MSNTIPRRKEYPNESRMETAIRLRASIKPQAHSVEFIKPHTKGHTFHETVAAIKAANVKDHTPHHATTIVQVVNHDTERGYTEFSLIGKPAKCYIEETVRWALSLQDTLRVLALRPKKVQQTFFNHAYA